MNCVMKKICVLMSSQIMREEKKVLYNISYDDGDADEGLMATTF